MAVWVMLGRHREGNLSTWETRGNYINYWDLFRNGGNMLSDMYMWEC